MKPNMKSTLCSFSSGFEWTFVYSNLSVELLNVKHNSFSNTNIYKNTMQFSCLKSAIVGINTQLILTLPIFIDFKLARTYYSPSQRLVPKAGALFQTEQNTAYGGAKSSCHARCGTARHKITLLVVFPKVLKYLLMMKKWLWNYHFTWVSHIHYISKLRIKFSTFITASSCSDTDRFRWSICSKSKSVYMTKQTGAELKSLL